MSFMFVSFVSLVQRFAAFRIEQCSFLAASPQGSAAISLLLGSAAALVAAAGWARLARSRGAARGNRPSLGPGDQRHLPL